MKLETRYSLHDVFYRMVRVAGVPVPCPACDATGSVPLPGPAGLLSDWTCPVCGGAAQIPGPGVWQARKSFVERIVIHVNRAEATGGEASTQTHYHLSGAAWGTADGNPFTESGLAQLPCTEVETAKWIERREANDADRP